MSFSKASPLLILSAFRTAHFDLFSTPVWSFLRKIISERKISLLLSDRRLRVTHTQLRGLGESSGPTLHVGARNPGVALLDITSKGQGLKYARNCINFSLMSLKIWRALFSWGRPWAGREQSPVWAGREFPDEAFYYCRSLMAQSGN